MNIHDWLQDRATTPFARISEIVPITAEHEKHLGPSWERAGACIFVEPASEFSVEVSDDIKVSDELLEYANAVAKFRAASE